MATACIGYRHRPTPLVTSASYFDVVVYAVVRMFCILSGADDRDTKEINMLNLTCAVAVRLDSFNLASSSPGINLRNRITPPQKRQRLREMGNGF